MKATAAIHWTPEVFVRSRRRLRLMPIVTLCLVLAISPALAPLAGANALPPTGHARFGGVEESSAKWWFSPGLQKKLRPSRDYRTFELLTAPKDGDDWRPRGSIVIDSEVAVELEHAGVATLVRGSFTSTSGDVDGLLISALAFVEWGNAEGADMPVTPLAIGFDADALDQATAELLGVLTGKWKDGLEVVQPHTHEQNRDSCGACHEGCFDAFALAISRANEDFDSCVAFVTVASVICIAACGGAGGSCIPLCVALAAVAAAACLDTHGTAIERAGEDKGICIEGCGPPEWP